MKSTRVMHNPAEGKGEYLREEFDSLAEFADFAERRQEQSMPSPAALKMAREGWIDETDKAMEIAESAVQTLQREGLMPKPVSPVWDVSGSEVDVARFTMGAPECMIEFPPLPAKGKVPTIVLVKSFTYWGSLTDKQLRTHGRMVCALAFALEKLQLPVEVWIDRPLHVSWNRATNKPNLDEVNYYQCIPLKRGDDIMDPGQLMFGLCHEWMLRDLGFNVHHSAGPRQRPCAEAAFYGPEAIQTETVPPTGEPADVLRVQLKRLGLLAE